MKKIETRPGTNRKRVYTINNEPSKTDPSFKDDCDANLIIGKMLRGQDMAHVFKYKDLGVYADVSEIPDLLGAIGQVQQAQAAFDALPAEVRKRFNNSPVEMVNFLKDPNNRAEAAKLGLLDPQKLGPTDTSAESKRERASSNSKTTSTTHKQTKKTEPKNDDELNDDESGS